jgi:hypothetical protein
MSEQYVGELTLLLATNVARAEELALLRKGLVLRVFRGHDVAREVVALESVARLWAKARESSRMHSHSIRVGADETRNAF